MEKKVSGTQYKKKKLPTFDSLSRKTIFKVKTRIINIKEERKLMVQFIIAARTRPDIDLSFYFGECEFSVVPRSLFTADGLLHQTTDKSIITKEPWKDIQTNNSVTINENEGEQKL